MLLAAGADAHAPWQRRGLQYASRLNCNHRMQTTLLQLSQAFDEETSGPLPIQLAVLTLDIQLFAVLSLHLPPSGIDLVWDQLLT